MLWDPFLYCINDSIQGNSETGNKVFVLPSKVDINNRTRIKIIFFRFGKTTAAKGTISVFDRGLHVSDTFTF